MVFSSVVLAERMIYTTLRADTQYLLIFRVTEVTWIWFATNQVRRGGLVGLN
jgi:hypothetical protein